MHFKDDKIGPFHSKVFADPFIEFYNIYASILEIPLFLGEAGL
jgi:hypothetical protein